MIKSEEVVKASLLSVRLILSTSKTVFFRNG
jgi:hypothetical protein